MSGNPRDPGDDRTHRFAGTNPCAANTHAITDFAPDEDTIAETLPVFFARLSDQHRPEDIVQGLVPGSGLTMFHGQPRSLKSWAALEIARAVSTGTPAFGLEQFHVPRAVPVWYVTDEDPPLEIKARFGCLLAAGGAEPSELQHVSVQRCLTLDEPTVQRGMTTYAKRHNIKLVIIDPVRASSGAVDQGPRELRPLAAFLRQLMRETGCVVLLVHHDVKPIRGTQDHAAKPQRASGGGVFSIADAPVHCHLLSEGKTLVTPALYKFATAPAPFIIRLDADDPKRPTWVRMIGEATTAGAAGVLELHTKILAYLREHRGTSGSKLAKAIQANKSGTLAALDVLSAAGRVDSFKRGQAQLWHVLADGA